MRVAITDSTEEEFVRLPIQQRTLAQVDLSDGDLPQEIIGTTIVARSRNGDAYALATNDEGVVIGLQS